MVAVGEIWIRLVNGYLYIYTLLNQASGDIEDIGDIHCGLCQDES